MKNWLTQAIAGVLAVAALTLTACDKDEVKTTLTPSNLPTINSSTNSIVLTQTNSTQNAITFNWTPVGSFNWSNAAHPYEPAVNYVLQVSTPENNFGAPASIPAGAGPSTTLTVEQLNAGLVNLGLTPGIATLVQIRLAAIVQTAANSPISSAPISLTVTPYKVCLPPNADKWAVIGDAVEGWSTDVALTYDCDTKTYNITRALKAGPFKFRKNGDWPGNLGDNGADKTLEADGANITVPTDGTYTIALNIAASTYILTKK